MKSIDDIKKSRGRPSVDTQAVLVRIGRTQLNALDLWAHEQPDSPSRPEAIRQILTEYLKRRKFLK